MRTAKVLKVWAMGVALMGVVGSWILGSTWFIQAGGMVLSITLWLVLRLAANIGQLAYDLKAELIAVRLAFEKHQQLLQARKTLQVAQVNSELVARPNTKEMFEPFTRTQSLLGELQKLREVLGEDVQDGGQVFGELKSALEGFSQLREELDASGRRKGGENGHDG